MNFLHVASLPTLGLAVLATEYAPPPGNDNWLANLMYFAVFIAAISHVIKLWTPKPPLNEQMEKLLEHVEKHFASRESVTHLATRVESVETDNRDLHHRITTVATETANELGNVVGQLRRL